MTSSNVIIELKSVQDESFSVPFKIDFSKLRYIGDNLASISPFDFPLIVFRFTSSNQKQ